MPSLFYIGYDVKREERYFPPFELVRRLAKPPYSGGRQMIRGEASIICSGYDRKQRRPILPSLFF